MSETNQLTLPAISRATMSLLVRMHKMSQIEGYCYAADDHFATKMGKSVGTIRNMITKLKKWGVITVDYCKHSRHPRRIYVWITYEELVKKIQDLKEVSRPKKHSVAFENHVDKKICEQKVNEKVNEKVNPLLYIEKGRNEINNKLDSEKHLDIVNIPNPDDENDKLKILEKHYLEKGIYETFNKLHYWKFSASQMNYFLKHKTPKMLSQIVYNVWIDRKKIDIKNITAVAYSRIMKNQLYAPSDYFIHKK